MKHSSGNVMLRGAYSRKTKLHSSEHLHVLEWSSQDPDLIPVKNLTGPMLFCEQRMEKTAVSVCAKLVNWFLTFFLKERI